MPPESATLNSEPEEQLYGKQTELGASNFPSESHRLADIPALVRNFALVKAAAARANGQLGAIASEVAEAIEKAATEIVEGRHDAQFPTALVLGGGGTTTNMNINEVNAARASQILGRPVHPNDHVNTSQSTNDTYPTAMAPAVHDLVAAPLTDIEELIAAFTAKGEVYADTVRLGRTCLQDAVTLTVGETHRSHATALTRCLKQLREASAHLTEVPLGATVLWEPASGPSRASAKRPSLSSPVSTANRWLPAMSSSIPSPTSIPTPPSLPRPAAPPSPWPRSLRTCACFPPAPSAALQM